jgi:uncharacterized membrane protein
MTTHVPPDRIRSIQAQARLNGVPVSGQQSIKVAETCIIHRPAAELYAFCRNLRNLKRLINAPLDILPLDEQNCFWRLTSSINGQRVGWNAVIINEEPDQLIAWQTLEGAPIPNAGTIRFQPAPGGVGTEVTVQLDYERPVGKLGKFAAQRGGDEPKQQMAEALRHFKVLMEMEATTDAGRAPV